MSRRPTIEFLYAAGRMLAEGKSPAVRNSILASVWRPGDGGEAGGPLIVTVPIPNRLLNPNNQGAPRDPNAARRKAKAIEEQKRKWRFGTRAAAEAAASVRADLAGELPWPVVRADVLWLHDRQGGKNGDPSNRKATLKAVLDGLTDAGVIVDDDLSDFDEVEERRDAADPRVVLAVRPFSPQA